MQPFSSFWKLPALKEGLQYLQCLWIYLATVVQRVPDSTIHLINQVDSTYALENLVLLSFKNFFSIIYLGVLGKLLATVSVIKIT